MRDKTQSIWELDDMILQHGLRWVVDAIVALRQAEALEEFQRGVGVEVCNLHQQEATALATIAAIIDP